MKKSAGILVYRIHDHIPEFFLVHPGGPLWKGKELGAWSIPKGEFSDEDPLEAARREFREETGYALSGNFIELLPVKQKSGKWVYAWAVEASPDATAIVSNTFQFEWPYKSGKWIEVSEVDRAAWFGFDEALKKINPAQVPLLHELRERLEKNR